MLLKQHILKDVLKKRIILDQIGSYWIKSDQILKKPLLKKHGLKKDKFLKKQVLEKTQDLKKVRVEYASS